MEQNDRGAIRKLASETAIYGMSTILARVINFLLVPLYTRVLTQSDYGVVTEFMAYIAVLQVILTMGLETGCFRFANKEGVDRNVVYSNAIVIISSLSILFLLAMILFGDSISASLGYEDFYNCFIYIGIILATDSFTSVLFAKLRIEGKALKFALIKTAKILTETLSNILLFFVLPGYIANNPDSIFLRFVSATPDFSYVIFAIFISCILCLILFIPDILRLSFRPERKVAVSMLRYSIPLMIAGLPGVINEFLDRILFRFFNVDDTLWRADLGVFQAAVKLAVIMSLFIQMFRFAAEPFFFSKAENKGSKELYAKVMEYFVAFGMLIFLGVMLYMDVIGLILGKDFRAGIVVVPVMLMAYLLLGINFNVSMWYKLSDRSSYAIPVTLAGLIVTAVINVVFMPLYSYHAAAWGHLLSYLSMLIINIVLGAKYYPIPYRWLRIIRTVMIALIVYAISLLLPDMNLVLKLSLHSILILLYIFVWLKAEKIKLSDLIKK